jgi:hypothetical protein
MLVGLLVTTFADPLQVQTLSSLSMSMTERTLTSESS